MIPEGHMSRGYSASQRGTIPPMKRSRAIRRLLILPGAVAAWLVLAGSVAAHGAVPDAAPDAANLILGWEIEPIVTIPLLIAGFAWWRLLATVDRLHPEHPVPQGQRWVFIGGLAVVAVALQSGIARYDTTLFSLHMVQHLLLSFVAPPMLALGAPITQILRAAAPGTRKRWLLPILHSRALAVIGHPIVAWVVFAGVMWGTHFSPIFDQSLENRLLHDLEHGLYLAAGLLFWWPLVGLDPAPRRMSHPARIAYVFLQMPQNSFLAMTILFADTALYPHYATLGAPYGIDALSDQRLAAGIMWFVGDVIFLIATMAVLAVWMRSESRITDASDRRADDERAAIRDREAALRLRHDAETADQAGAGVSSSER